MQHIPMDYGVDLNPKLFHRTSMAVLNMGFTAEFLAMTNGIGRQEQDTFAARSHQRSAAAHAAGEFKPEIIPLYGRDEEGNRMPAAARTCAGWICPTKMACRSSWSTPPRFAAASRTWWCWASAVRLWATVPCTRR